MKLRPSDLRRVGTTRPHVYAGPKGVGMVWSINGDVRGTDGTATFSYVGEADTATEAKRIFCDWHNRKQQGRE